MKITGQQLREVIKEAISEVNGRLDDSFHNLAEFIMKKFYRLCDRHGDEEEWSFNVTEKEFGRFNNYYNVPFKSLKISVENDNGEYEAAYGYNGDIHMTKTVAYGDYDNAVSILEHELTHLVQSKQGAKKMAMDNQSLGFRGIDKSYGINYCFDPQEMAARISQAYRFANQQLESYLMEAYFDSTKGTPSFQEFYKTVWECLDDEDCFKDTLSGILMLNDMSRFIKRVRKESFRKFLTALRNDDSYSLMVELLVTNFPYYLEKVCNGFFGVLKSKYPGKDPLMYATDEELKYLFDFYKARLLNYYTNAYENYKKKINKTLSLLVMGYFERGMKEWEYAQ